MKYAWPNMQLGATPVALAVALFLVLTANHSFWQALAAAIPMSARQNADFAAAVFVFLSAAFTLIFSLFGFKTLFKPVMVMLLLCAAVTSYFMDTYGVVIDRGMLQNALQTDPLEARELITLTLFWHVLWAGVLPALVVVWLPIRYRSFGLQLLTRLATVAVAAVVVGAVVWGYYKDFSLVGRQHHGLRYLINPTYPIYAASQLLVDNIHVKDTRLKPLGTDARLAGATAPGKHKLVVLVLGETARAASFSLNGYARDTNPRLAKLNVINYPDATSCGTATAASLPCMFSRDNRSDYDEFDAEYTENLLDVLRRAGIQVLWRDNNSGCKGVCARVPAQNTTALQVPAYCNDQECFDEILLYQLQPWLRAHQGDAFIVLHQHGSHGPEYYRRYPPRFAKFTPVCQSKRPQNCSRQEIINAYDNSILYTDYFLSRVIRFLQAQGGNYQSAMIYLSDHGESLGENGIYLHGFPYLLAPREQTHVPLLMWLSPDFLQHESLDAQCLRRHSRHPVSHDNLFDSVLGLLRVRTRAYRAEQDLFAPCRGTH